MINPCHSCVKTIADLLDDDDRLSAANFVRDHFLPESPAQQLAEESGGLLTEEAAQWVLDHFKRPNHVDVLAARMGGKFVPRDDDIKAAAKAKLARSAMQIWSKNR